MLDFIACSVASCSQRKIYRFPIKSSKWRDMRREAQSPQHVYKCNKTPAYHLHVHTFIPIKRGFLFRSLRGVDDMGGVQSGTHNLGEALWVQERQRQKCHRWVASPLIMHARNVHCIIRERLASGDAAAKFRTCFEGGRDILAFKMTNFSSFLYVLRDTIKLYVTSLN